jgi:hypothetical protein
MAAAAARTRGATQRRRIARMTLTFRGWLQTGTAAEMNGRVRRTALPVVGRATRKGLAGPHAGRITRASSYRIAGPSGPLPGDARCSAFAL